jgi:hypothetical protein
MSANARACMERLLVVLRAVTVLSDRTDRVMIGEAPDNPEGVPRLYITASGIQSEHAHGLGQYQRTLSVTIIGYVGRPGGATEGDGELTLAALDLLDSVTEAIEADRTLNGTCLDLIIQGDALPGKVFGVPHLGCFVALVSPWWIANSGAGL